MHAAAKDYPWAEELEKTVVNSLATSFGLDFLLLQDKDGGDVNTIHNVRNKIWATDEEKQNHEQRGAYDPDPYHDHANYIATGARDKLVHQAGELHDPYRNATLAPSQKRNLDHVISAKTIHDDPGRKLAGLDGVTLANQSSNLQTTHESINKSKGQKPINDYLNGLPGLICEHEKNLASKRQLLAKLPRDTPQEQHRARQLEDKIRKDANKIEALKAIDPQEMRKRDEAARAPYNEQINRAYYTSSKFWEQTASASLRNGWQMGTRQMLGLVLAEVWFELRGQLPILLDKLKNRFDFEIFIDSVNATLKGIWERVRNRFTDFLITFKDGVFAGVMASATTTLFNVFATTKVMAIKIIREVWSQLVKAIKLMIFNPEKLGFVELCKAISSLMSLGAATAVGTMAHTHLLPLCSFPFGSELAAFASALLTGVVTLGLNYVLLHSPMGLKLWAFVESIMPHADAIQHFQAVNAELDRYLTELSLLEFNLDVAELEAFGLTLTACNDELQRSRVLQEEVAKRDIELPFEAGNSASTRQWLASLT